MKAIVLADAYADVPMKYRTSMETAKEWARGVLSSKYGVPEKNIYFGEWGSLK